MSQWPIRFYRILVKDTNLHPYPTCATAFLTYPTDSSVGEAGAKASQRRTCPAHSSLRCTPCAPEIGAIGFSQPGVVVNTWERLVNVAAKKQAEGGGSALTHGALPRSGPAQRRY